MTVARATYSFTLDTQKDRHLIRWLEGLPHGEKSAAIREALDAHLGGGGVTLGDVYQVVKTIERQMGQGGYMLVQAGPGVGRQAVDEPPDVAANLDSLGL